MQQADTGISFGFLMTETKKISKPQLLEEPFVLAGLVSVFKLDLGLPSGLAFHSRVSEDVLVDGSFVQGDVHRVPRAREVIVAINFHKRLDLRPLGDFLLARGSCPFAGTVVNSSQQSMAVEEVRPAIINVLHDDHFASGVASS